MKCVSRWAKRVPGRFTCIAATARSQAEAEAMIAPLLTTIEIRFGEHLLGNETLEQQVARLLAEQEVALLLRETIPYAPVFRALSVAPRAPACAIAARPQITAAP